MSCHVLPCPQLSYRRLPHFCCFGIWQDPPAFLRSIIICHSFMICFFLCYEALQPSVTLDPYKACNQPVSYFFSHRFRFET